MSSVIEIENLSKEYRLGVIGYGTLREDLQSWWAKVRGKEDPNSILFSTNRSDDGTGPDHILALDDVNLTVEKGERLGIIGRNGAGKTTLLKILAQIASPSKGTAKIKGSVASLIAVGTGFHSELTGRENIYLDGAILGLKKYEIDQRFDEIVDFSGVEQFIDTPIKRYSSGMQIRLGFAVAAHLEPDVMIIDEVLAVGDYTFQKKCIGKMKDATSEGRTLLFVSHNLSSIRELCPRTILLDKGRKVQDGETQKVLEGYIAESTVGIKLFGVRKVLPDEMSSNADGVVRLNSVNILNASGSICEAFSVRREITIEIDYHVLTDLELLDVQIGISNQSNTSILFSFDDQDKQSLADRKKKAGKYISKCVIPGDFLNEGTYIVAVKLSNRNEDFFEDHTGVYFEVYDVMDSKGARGVWDLGTNNKWPAVAVRPKLAWDISYNRF